jgi:hypothetical protein
LIPFSLWEGEGTQAKCPRKISLKSGGNYLRNILSKVRDTYLLHFDDIIFLKENVAGKLIMLNYFSNCFWDNATRPGIKELARFVIIKITEMNLQHSLPHG